MTPILMVGFQVNVVTWLSWYQNAKPSWILMVSFQVNVVTWVSWYQNAKPSWILLQ